MRTTAMHMSATRSEQEKAMAGISDELFDQLYQDLWPRVLSYVRLRVGDADGHDIAAEAFTRAWSHRSSFDGERGTAEAWLWTIVRNATVDHLRKGEPVTGALEPQAIVGNLDEDVVEEHELRRTLHSVSRLATTDREIIALRFGGGHTNRSIAEMLSMTEGNVAVRLHRALRRVREDIETEQEAGS